MILELDFADKNGGTQCSAQLDLNMTTNTWTIQEGDGMKKVGFSTAGGNLAWVGNKIRISDKNYGSLGNAILIHSAPRDVNATTSTGEGEFVDPVYSKFDGGSVTWSIQTLTDIRLMILAMVDEILPPIGAFRAPGTPPMIAKFPGVKGETNCYILPGYIGDRLEGNISQVVKENLPDTTSPTGYSMQNVTVNINKGSMSLEKFARQLDAQFNSRPGALKIWNDYVPVVDKRPMPGDFYVLEKTKGKGVNKITITQHVGIIIDSTGDVWRTADSGQSSKAQIPLDAKKQPVYAKGFSAGYRDRTFLKGTGEILGEDGTMVRLKGWLHTDHPLLFPKYATPRS